MASILAGVFFHYAPRLPETWLFYLKVVSFSATALLGVVGVVTDFKDENKKLTKAGKLNLAGLVFASIIGIVSQRAESINAKNAGAVARKNYDVLLTKNNEVLEQSARGLEPIGETISVRYQAEIPITESRDKALGLDNSNSDIKMLMRLLSQGVSRYNPKKLDAHTSVKHTEDVYQIGFDRDSSFANAGIFKFPLFSLVFFKNKPEPKQKEFVSKITLDGQKVFTEDCWFKNSDLTFDWDKTQHYNKPSVWDAQGKKFDDIVYIYDDIDTVDPTLVEEGDDSKFIIGETSGRVLSVRDLSGAYLQVVWKHIVHVKLQKLTLRVGGRELEINVEKPIGEECYRNVYKLPVFN